VVELLTRDPRRAYTKRHLVRDNTLTGLLITCDDAKEAERMRSELAATKDWEIVHLKWNNIEFIAWSAEFKRLTEILP
jgi:hypothetical protein